MQLNPVWPFSQSAPWQGCQSTERLLVCHGIHAQSLLFSQRWADPVELTLPITQHDDAKTGSSQEQQAQPPVTMLI